MNDLLAIPLPETPLKPAPKKTKRDPMDSSNTSMEILTAIRELSGKYDQKFQKISAIEITTGSTAKQIETLSSTVTQLVTEVATHKESLKVVDTEIQELQNANKTLKAEIGESKRYSWKWTLKLHGMREKDGEDARKVVIDVLSNVVPGISDNLEGAIDIAHRLGPKRGDVPTDPSSFCLHSVVFATPFGKLPEAVNSFSTSCDSLKPFHQKIGSPERNFGLLLKKLEMRAKRPPFAAPSH